MGKGTGPKTSVSRGSGDRGLESRSWLLTDMGHGRQTGTAKNMGKEQKLPVSGTKRMQGEERGCKDRRFENKISKGHELQKERIGRGKVTSPLGQVGPPTSAEKEGGYGQASLSSNDCQIPGKKLENGTDPIRE